MRDFSVCCASGLLHMLRMFGDAAVLMSDGHFHDAAALAPFCPESSMRSARQNGQRSRRRRREAKPNVGFESLLI